MESLFDVTTKRCSKCGKEKSIDQFCKDKHTKDLLSCWCKECKNNKDKKWYLKNRDLELIKSAEYNKNHKEKLQANSYLYYKKNKEKVKKYHLDRKEHFDILHKKWLKTDKGKAKTDRTCFRYRTNFKNVICNLTAIQWEEIKQSQNYCCLHCGKPEPEITLTKDHIIPVSKGGNHTKDNIQGLCQKCNTRKLNKIESLAMIKMLRKDI